MRERNRERKKKFFFAVRIFVVVVGGAPTDSHKYTQPYVFVHARTLVCMCLRATCFKIYNNSKKKNKKQTLMASIVYPLPLSITDVHLSSEHIRRTTLYTLDVPCVPACMYIAWFAISAIIDLFYYPQIGWDLYFYGAFSFISLSLSLPLSAQICCCSAMLFLSILCSLCMASVAVGPEDNLYPYPGRTVKAKQKVRHQSRTRTTYTHWRLSHTLPAHIIVVKPCPFIFLSIFWCPINDIKYRWYSRYNMNVNDFLAVRRRTTSIVGIPRYAEWGLIIAAHFIQSFCNPLHCDAITTRSNILAPLPYDEWTRNKLVESTNQKIRESNTEIKTLFYVYYQIRNTEKEPTTVVESVSNLKWTKCCGHLCK